MVYHTLPLKKVKKQGEMPLPSLSHIPLFRPSLNPFCLIFASCTYYLSHAHFTHTHTHTYKHIHTQYYAAYARLKWWVYMSSISNHWSQIIYMLWPSHYLAAPNENIRIVLHAHNTPQIMW